MNIVTEKIELPVVDYSAKEVGKVTLPGILFEREHRPEVCQG